MRILLTGGSGGLGRNIVECLRRDPGVDLCLAERADWAEPGLLLSRTRPEVVIHSAACGLSRPRPDPLEMIDFNVNATLRLFQASRDTHFVYIGSALAYVPQGRPLCETDPLGSNDTYAASKGAAEWLLRATAIAERRRLTIVRPFAFTGLYDRPGRLFPALLSAAQRGQAFDMTSGGQIRDFCAVQDIAAAIRQIAKRSSGEGIEVFNLGSGDAIRLKVLVGRVCQDLNLDVSLKFGAAPYLPAEPMHLVANTEKSFRLLGWKAETDLAYAVWQLAQASFPNLEVACPKRSRS